MSFSKSQKARKKSHNSIEEEEDDEEKPSTTKKILNSFTFFGKNVDIRKSKRKINLKTVLFEDDMKVTDCDITSPKDSTLDLSMDDNSDIKNYVTETVNVCVLNNQLLSNSSKEPSEHDSASVFSDYSYNRLSDSSAISSSDNLEATNVGSTEEYNDMEAYKSNQSDYEKTDSLSTIQSVDGKASFESTTKSKSFSRKNSFKRTLKGIFRKANSEPQTSHHSDTPKLARKGSETTQKSSVPKLFRKYSDNSQNATVKLTRKTSDPSQKCHEAKLFRKISEPIQKPYESTSKLFRKNSDSSATPQVKKTSSIKKKISNFINMSDGSSLTRSSSTRDIQKRAGKANSFAEWQTSFKSLVETDIGVSYQDMSFVNYDALNLCSYKDEKKNNNNFIRCHSMSMHNVGSFINT